MVFKLNILYFILLLHSVPIFVQAQTDSLDRLDQSGKKTGYWKVYLDENLAITSKDSARFYAYEIYDGGLGIFTYGKIRKNERLEYDSVFPPKGMPRALSGKFTRIYKEGNTKIEEYKNGLPYRLQYYYYSGAASQQVRRDEFRSIQYPGQPGSYMYKFYNYDQSFSRYWFRKGKKGWRSYPLKSDSIGKKMFKGLSELNVSFTSYETAGEYTVRVIQAEDNKLIYESSVNQTLDFNVDSLQPGEYKILAFKDDLGVGPVLIKTVYLKADQKLQIEIELHIKDSDVDISEPAEYESRSVESDFYFSYMKDFIDPNTIFKEFYGAGFSQFAWFPLKRHFGLLIGGGLGFNQYRIKKDTSILFPKSEKIFESYNYANAHFESKFRLSSANLKNNAHIKGVYLDIGAAYNFPLLFRHNTWLKDNKKFINRGLHQFTDIRAFINLGYKNLALFAEYRLSDFVIGNYPELPVLNAGLRIIALQ